MAGWVEEHPDVVLWLVAGHGRAEGERLGHRGVEVADLDAVPGSS